MKKLFHLSAGVLLLVPFLFFSFAQKKNYNYSKADSDTAILPTFAYAVDHLGKNTVNKRGAVTLSTGFDNDYYAMDSVNQRGYLYVEVNTDLVLAERMARNRVNIAIVIDRSGSMAGEKMQFAKNAAYTIIDKLTPDDFVTVVVYDEFIDVIQVPTPVLYKDSIKAKIAKIKPRGSTNLWGGSEKGYEGIKTNYRPDYINRVLLISDGNITAGPKIPSRIIEWVQRYKDVEGISISTFGVGLDYNEMLMTDMAENGAGNYYYIDRAEKLEAMFDREIYRLLHVAAQNAELRITLPKGIVLEKMYPFKYAQTKNEVFIRFQDLSSLDSKSLFLQFKLDEKADKELRWQTKLTYINTTDKQPMEIVNEHIWLPTNNRQLYLSHFNSTVASQVVLFTVNENMEKAMYEVDRGNYEAAKRYVETGANYLRQNALYVKNSQELQQMDSINRQYANELLKVKTMSKDSVKLIQKERRAQNYKIRTKKN